MEVYEGVWNKALQNGDANKARGEEAVRADLFFLLRRGGARGSRLVDHHDQALPRFPHILLTARVLGVPRDVDEAAADQHGADGVVQLDKELLGDQAIHLLRSPGCFRASRESPHRPCSLPVVGLIHKLRSGFLFLRIASGHSCVRNLDSASANGTG